MLIVGANDEISLDLCTGTAVPLASPCPFTPGRITVSRSYDDGATWSDAVEASSIDRKSSFADHEWIAVDKPAGSPWFGRLHIFWADYCNTWTGNGRVKLYVAHSATRGAPGRPQCR